MRPGAQKDTLVRKNLTLYPRTVHRLDNLRELAECSSDSEVIRQSLRYFEQFVDDWKSCTPLTYVRSDGIERQITMSDLNEAEEEGPYTRRNLIIHRRSIERLATLQADSGLPSESETVRYSLRLFEILLTEAEHGSRFFTGVGSDRMEVRLGNIARRLPVGSSPVRPSVPQDNRAEAVASVAPAANEQERA